MMNAILISAAMAGFLAQDPPPDKAQMTIEVRQAIQDGIKVANQTLTVLGGQMLDAGNPVKGQPYSAEAVTESTQTLTDGSRIVNKSSSMIYRDSEGRERREVSLGKLGSWSTDGPPASMVFISDPVAKVSYTLNPKEHTARKNSVPAGIARLGADAEPVTSMPLPAGGGDHIFFEQRMITGNEPATKREDLGTQTIEGVTATGTRTTRIIPAGQIGN